MEEKALKIEDKSLSATPVDSPKPLNQTPDARSTESTHSVNGNERGNRSDNGRVGRATEMSKLKKYKIIQKLGQGTFGVVQKAKNLETNKLVALKQLLNHSAKEGFPITAMREITILKELHHKNILELVDMVYEPPKISNPLDVIHQRGCFYTVSPYMSSDLVGLLKNPNVKLEVPHIKCLMQQLLRGIQYIHEQKFLHRDIKAANILVDFDGVLKIADFGLARLYHGKSPQLGSGPGGGERLYTGLVVTRWYRPPELLLGEKKYTTAVDLWGIGCVFGELFTHHPILVGKSDSHQAQLVFELVGAPSTIAWPDAINLPNKSDLSIGITCKRTLEQKFANLITPDGIDLLSGLLTLDPYKRLNALDALDHEYFKNLPLPLLPGQLPKFEECHEIDSERFKMMGNTSNKPINGVNSVTNGSKPQLIAEKRTYKSTFGPDPTQDTHRNDTNNNSSNNGNGRGGYSRDTYFPKKPMQQRDRPYTSSFLQHPKQTPENSKGIFMNKRPTGPRGDMKRRRLDNE